MNHASSGVTARPPKPCRQPVLGGGGSNGGKLPFLYEE
jgi:hypothetical protein